MKPICWIGLAAIAYLLVRKKGGSLGMISTTESHRTVHDTPRPGQTIAYFQRFSQDALNNYYAGNDIDAADNLRLAKLSLDNISTAAAIPLGSKYEDLLEKMNPVGPGSIIISGDIPPPPPF